MALIETVTRTNYQEFINMEVPDDDHHIYELLDGEIVKYSAPKTRHQMVSANLHRAIGGCVKRKRLGLALFNLSVVLGKYNALQPDLLFVATKNLKIIEEEGVMSAPDLVVEILSPGSVVRDRVQKKDIYEKAAVPEYWIVDPKYFSVEIYQYTDSGYYNTSTCLDHWGYFLS